MNRKPKPKEDASSIYSIMANSSLVIAFSDGDVKILKSRFGTDEVSKDDLYFMLEVIKNKDNPKYKQTYDMFKTWFNVSC